MTLQFFLRNLSVEIQQVAKKEDIDVHQNFLSYYLTLLVYDPQWNMHPKMNEIVRMDALKMINFVVKKLRHLACPCIVALKLSFYFECNFEEQRIIVDTEKYNFQLRLQPLLNDMFDANTSDGADFEKLFKKLLYYCTLSKGLGNPMNESVYKESYQALRSFVDADDLERFRRKKADAKLEQLNRIAAIFSGIRLYNWTTKKAVQGIEDIPSLLYVHLMRFEEDANALLKQAIINIDSLTSAIDYVFVIEEDVTKISMEFHQTCVIPDGIEYEDIEYFKDMIIIYRQIQVYCCKLLDVCDQMKLREIELRSSFKHCIERFSEITDLRTGVETSKIFPLFIELDGIWQQLQNEIIYLKRMYKIAADLFIYIKDFVIADHVLDVLMDHRPLITDDERMVPQEFEPPIGHANVEVVLPTDEAFASLLNSVDFAFLGFDVWRLMESQGALFPGNPYMGLFVYESKYYAFSCPESAFMFCKYPKHTVGEALELARKKVELIPILQLESELAAVQTIKELVTEKTSAEAYIPTKTQSLQTCVHTDDGYIDRNYKWNIWDLKREALQLANIANMRSKSNNTKSAAVNAAATQTYNVREQGVQTLKDNSTNTSTPLTFFFGLRGRKDDQQYILNLTKPPEKR